jgi:hypothetical protein
LGSKAPHDDLRLDVSQEGSLRDARQIGQIVRRRSLEQIKDAARLLRRLLDRLRCRMAIAAR